MVAGAGESTQANAPRQGSGGRGGRAGAGVHAEAEAQAVAAAWSGARLLAEGRATRAAVAAQLARADLVHVAAHGTFRPDNPMFSSLTLADGGLHLFELEQLPAVAPAVVLSACNSGLAQVAAGDELMAHLILELLTALQTAHTETSEKPAAARTA